MGIIFLIVLTIFYSSFFIKVVFMKRHGITVNLLGKGEKTAKARFVEQMIKVVTYLGATIQFISIFFLKTIWGLPAVPSIKIIGLSLSIAGSVFFITAMITMKNNWRAGYSKQQNTSLVNSGIYKISRNPAFVGFDLLYIGCALAFPNVINLIVTIFAVTVFHVQILDEERFLEATFGVSYQQYKSRVNRYLGQKARL